MEYVSGAPNSHFRYTILNDKEILLVEEHDNGIFFRGAGLYKLNLETKSASRLISLPGKRIIEVYSDGETVMYCTEKQTLFYGEGLPQWFKIENVCNDDPEPEYLGDSVDYFLTNKGLYEIATQDTPDGSNISNLCMVDKQGNRKEIANSIKTIWEFDSLILISKTDSDTKYIYGIENDHLFESELDLSGYDPLMVYNDVLFGIKGYDLLRYDIVLKTVDSIRTTQSYYLENCLFLNEDKLYLLDSRSGELWCLDINEDKWTKVANLPQDKTKDAFYGGFAVISGKVMIYANNTCHLYDMQTESWNTIVLK